jgi:hypothetical protein
MEIDNSPYSYELIVGYEMLYIFKTDYEVLYEVRFKPTPYLFSSDKPYANDAYEFSIIVIDNPNHVSPPFDNRIGETIAKVFDDFYSKFGNAINLYICASHDNRQSVRFRKFSGWFATFGSNKYFKFESFVTDAEGKKFPLALIIKSDNPYLKEIVDSFVDVINFYQK